MSTLFSPTILMRATARFATAIVALAAIAACHTAPPAPVLPPVPLSDSAQKAVQWVASHATAFSANDSVDLSAVESAQLTKFVGAARIIGISELTETAHEFPTVIRHALFALAESDDVRGLAIQAPMAEAMDLNRYVRNGIGDPRRLLHALGSWRYETREMQTLVADMRKWNTTHPDKQVGFYGFEIPTAAHAIQVLTTLRDSVTGPQLGAWLKRQYPCVMSDEGAHWGLEGRAADSSFWNGCRPIVTAAADSIVALRERKGLNTPAGRDLAFAEDMAKLVQHHVAIGLRHLPREDANAEHVLFLADLLGPTAKLLVWGGDVEMGRLTLPPNTVQTGESLGKRLGSKYRAIGFMVGTGAVRTRRPSTGARGGTVQGGQPGIADVPLHAPVYETYEDIFNRAGPPAYLIDLREISNDAAGAWLKGPRIARLISDLYTPDVPELFVATLEFPKEFDGVLFVHHVTPAR